MLAQVEQRRLSSGNGEQTAAAYCTGSGDWAGSDCQRADAGKTS